MSKLISNKVLKEAVKPILAEDKRMNRSFYSNLADRSIAGEQLPHEICKRILISNKI